MTTHEPVARPGDHHEQEAERVAAQVVHRDTAGPPGRDVDAPHDERALVREYGSALGHDFSRVRLHDDDAAHTITRRLGAEAVTIGSDVLFASGKRETASPDGRHRLAHELTHVRQQASSGPRVQGRFVATGDAAGFVAMVNAILAVQNRIAVNAAGEVSVQTTNVQGPPTRDATELLAQIRSMIAERATITIGFMHGSVNAQAGDTSVIVGNYALSRLDLDDLARFGGESSHSRMGDNTASMLQHELVEQQRKQINGEAFPAAHAVSLAAQGRMLGATWVGDVPRAVPGGVEITRTWRYPDGREVDTITTIDTATGNVTGVGRAVRAPRRTP